MAVESPNKSAISPLRFFNRTARVNQEGISVFKEKLVQIDSSFKKILSVKDRTIDTSKMEEEESQRQEKEKKLEAGKFFVRGVGKLANAIPGKNTIQKFLLFMAFGWLFNTFSKYFGQLSGPLSKLITGSVGIIDAFSKIAFGIFDGFATFVDIGYKTWDVIRGTGDSQKLQSALNNVLLDIDSFFGGILSLLGIVERPPEQQAQPGMTPGTPGGAPSGPGGPSPSSGNLPRVPQQGQAPPSSQTPQAPPAQVSGGIIPSQAAITSGYGAQEGFRKKPHSGIDYGYPVGTPISLVKGGIVVEAAMGDNGGYGNFVLIRHSDGKYSMFNHLDKIYVQKGQKISGSQGNAPVIGTIGNSGFSTGPHLDYKVATKWDGYNPSGFINPTSYQDSVFRIGADVKVKPSQIQKLGKKNGKEGIIVNGQWRAKPWTKDEKERYSRVSGQEQQQFGEGKKGSTSSGDLFEIIAGGEGGYNSVNRGYAGDTPGGASSVFGKPLTEMTVGEIVASQKSGKVFAVGKYQIIPGTMTGFLRQMGISNSAKFDAATQEKFKDYVINIKRPEVGRYIRGESSNRAEAVQELAREFASVGLAYSEAGRARGESRYAGSAGNRASISPESVEAALDRARSGGATISQSSSKSTPTSQASAQAAQEYAASKGKYYSSTTKKTYGSYSEALKDPEVQKAATKPERWATDPRGWFGMKGGGIVGDIPKQTKSTDVSSLSSYPSYSPESEESMKVLIQPVIIKVPTPSGKSRSSDFPVSVSVNNSMSNLSNLSQG
jgi:hypothetical protein